MMAVAVSLDGTQTQGEFSRILNWEEHENNGGCYSSFEGWHTSEITGRVLFPVSVEAVTSQVDIHSHFDWINFL